MLPRPCRRLHQVHRILDSRTTRRLMTDIQVAMELTQSRHAALMALRYCPN